MTGWPLLPYPVAGQLRYPSLEQSVREAIRVILCTRPGEPLMRPDFGAGIENFLNEPNTIVTRRRIRDLIVESLAKWEPRITVDAVDALEVPDQPARIRVEIHYRLRRTGEAQTLGLNVELGA